MIRQETLKDYEIVYEVIKEAFMTAEHRDGTEQDLATALRKGESFIPSLSLVFETDNKIVGHILFTQAWVGDTAVLALAPLAVLPAYQGKGIGSQLIQKGHEIAKNLGYEYSLVLGDPNYYETFGYQSGHAYEIEIPDILPAPYFMIAQLKDQAEKLEGKVRYAKEFGLDN